MALKISQSLIKDCRDYLNESICGNVMKAKWIDNTFPDDYDSDSMELGSYFEWCLTEMILGKGKGSVPKSGKIPRPQYYKKSWNLFVAATKAGKPFDLDEERDDEDEEGETVRIHYMKPYALAVQNAKRVVKYLNDMGITVLEAGKRMTKKHGSVEHEGTIDLLCSWKGKLIVIDLKYSGLLTEKWSRHGWTMDTDEQRTYHGTQAKEYKFLTDGLDFYFMVVCSKNKSEIKFLRIVVDEFTMEQHLLEAKDCLAKMKLWSKVGFVPHPELTRCTNCSIRESCTDKRTFPDPVDVDLRMKD